MATVQTVPTLLGQVGFNPQGEYQSERQYMRLDVVTHEGSSYACKKDCQAKPLTNTEYWQLIASKGDSYEVTQEDLQEIARAIQEDASSSFNQNVQTKTTEFNQNASSKTTDFNNNATSKTSDYNQNATNKTDDFNSNATSKTNTFNDNASSKTTTFNSNATTKTTEFNTNATGKTTDFDANATAQTTTFNANVVQKTVDFDNHAEDKTEDFDTNAETKTENFDENASEKTAEFNANFEDKNTMLEKNFNTANKVVTGSGQVTNALYWNAKTNKFGGGEVSQDTTEGKNKLYIDRIGGTSNGLTRVLNKDGSITVTGTGTATYVDYTAKISHIIPAGDYIFSIGNPAGVRVILRPSNANEEILGDVEISASGASKAFTINEDIASYKLLAGNANGTTYNYTIYPMIRPASVTDDTYEPYTGGISSPNPDYEQPVKMLTGNVSVEDGAEENLASNTTWTDGEYLDSSGNIVTSSGWSHTDYIDIHGKKCNVICQGRGNNPKHILYDGAKNMIGYMGVLDMVSYAIPEGTYYIKCSVAKSSKSTLKIYEGQIFPLTLPEGMYLGDLGEASNFIFKNEKNSPYYNSSLVENANYWHKGWNEVVLDESENWNVYNSGTENWYYRANLSIPSVKSGTGVLNILCNYFKPASIGNSNTNQGFQIIESTSQARIRWEAEDTIENFKTWLSTHNLVVAYQLATEENILITDTTLNAQIDAMWENMKTYGITNFVITGGDIAGKLDLDYYVDDRVDENGVSLQSRLASLEARVELLEQ